MRPFDSILAATDFSDCGDAAANEAVDRFGDSARILLLHVVDEAAVRLVADVTHRSAEEVAEELWSRASRRLAERRAAFEKRIHVETLVRRGPAAAEILAVAEEREVDLVVVGSHGFTHDGSGGGLGGTAERVVLGAHVPVLCIPDAREGTA